MNHDGPSTLGAISRREESLFESARRIENRAQRDAFLDAACAGNPELRVRVEELLRAAVSAEAFFTRGQAEPGLPANAAELLQELTLGQPGTGYYRAEEALGTQIDRYELLEKLGEGGCGVVYLAEQAEPVRRRVALKIIKTGMETRGVIARFEAERQALAIMDHPNIARVFDAGATKRGSPYFVMELVRGVRITTFCDEGRLDLRQRLLLFVQICHAIQHAHQKGIIHGDIKPSNIMVALHDGEPMPKVIDFGISKATEARLNDRLSAMGEGQVVGTPAYMSPEQAEMGGVDIDTRSDIYSLGVLLYELLTGRTPFSAGELPAGDPDRIRGVLRERIPVRPSERLRALPDDERARVAEHRRADRKRLGPSLADDLDFVVMKALEKDRARRYETANGLAMDIQRALSNEPVVARPSSWSYRARKTAARNRGAFIAGGAVIVTLLAGMSTSTWMFLREREARQRAVAAEQQQGRLRLQAEVRERITQAALLVSQERFGEADDQLRRLALTQPTMEGAAVLRRVGEWHALNQRWPEAADRFQQLLQVNHLDGPDTSTMDYLECGVALIEMGDTAAYQRFRSEALARFSAAPPPFIDRIVKISLLRPAAPALLASLRPLVEETKRSIDAAATTGDTFTVAWRSVAVALVEYREGNYAGAIRWSERCLSYAEFNAPRMAMARLILAMACHQLGQTERAVPQWEAFHELMANRNRTPLGRGTPVQGFWFDWSFVELLLAEAEGLAR